MPPAEIKTQLNNALDRLYEIDYFLIDNDLCERCINHRFALHLQAFFPEYYVDCEYNRSHIGDQNDQKRILGIENGNYVDIIVGRRNRLPAGDFICFETKKQNNADEWGRVNDIEKLRILTRGGQFAYEYGFHITYAQRRADVQIEAYRGGEACDW